MNLPRPEILKAYCNSFFVTVRSRLDCKGRDALIKAVPALKDKESTATFDNFTKGKGKDKQPIHSLLILGVSECEEKDHYHFYFRFQTQPGEISVPEKSRDSVDFGGLIGVLKQHGEKVSCNVQTTFEFPQDKFSTIVSLPYSKAQFNIEDDIEIRGLDLELKSGDDRHRQFIAVYDEDNIFQRVGFNRGKDALGVRMMPTLLSRSLRLAKELTSGRD